MNRVCCAYMWYTIDVSLTVPEDAVMFNMQHPYQQQQQQEVFVGVSRDDTHRPKLTGNFYLFIAQSDRDTFCVSQFALIAFCLKIKCCNNTALILT